MKKVLLLSFVLQIFFHISLAQDSSSDSSAPTTTTASTSLTPQMSASAVASFYSALATASPQQPGDGPLPGDAGSSSSSGGVDSDAGAAGADSSGFQLSKGALIAIIVVACFICVFGTISAILFYLAKKRDWKVRESIRRSARRVASALTPRSARFPRDVRRSRRGLTKIDEVPPTPKFFVTDVEKGNPKQMSFELTSPPKKKRWERKAGQ